MEEHRPTFVFVGLLALGACASAEGPPGKSQAQLDYENNLCSMRASRMYRFMDSNLAYAQCMVMFNNKVHLPDGRTFEPHYVYVAPPPQYYRPPDYRLPQYNPPPTVPSVPEPEQSAPSITQQTPTGHRWVFTQEQKERFTKDFAIQTAKAYFACRGEEHPWRCGAMKAIVGMSGDEREAICTDPDMLHDFLGISMEHQQVVVDLLHCSV